jgi:hypothetical protein
MAIVLPFLRLLLVRIELRPVVSPHLEMSRIVKMISRFLFAVGRIGCVV